MSQLGGTTRITKLLIQETGRYNDMWRRNYQTTWDDQVQQVLDERLTGMREFTPAAVSGVASKFITVAAQPEKMVTIPQGWGERRFRFLMEVEMWDVMGIRTVEILSGFSDMFDISRGHAAAMHINPDMVFNINSIMTIMDRVTMSPTGRQVHRVVADNSHLLFNKETRGMASPYREDFMRPEDIFGLMSLSSVSKDISRDSYDARTVLSTRPVKSSRSNGIAANYMSKIMEGYNTAWISNQLSPGEDTIYGNAMGNVVEKVAANDMFLNILRQVRQSMFAEGVFTLRNLETIDQAALNNPQITKFNIFAEAERSVSDTRQNSTTWHDSGVEHQMAAVLSQTVPALMMDLMLMGVEFRATNRALINSQDVVNVSGHIGFSEELNMSQHVLVFEKRMEQEVMRDLSKNGQIDYDVFMFVDMLNEARIRISIYGRPYVEFCAPTFCDALYVPLLTQNRDKAVGIAGDFESMHMQIISSTSDAAPLTFNNNTSY